MLIEYAGPTTMTTAAKREGPGRPPLPEDERAAYVLSPCCHVVYSALEDGSWQAAVFDPTTPPHHRKTYRFPSERDARRHIENARDVCMARRPRSVVAYGSVGTVVANALFWGSVAALVMLAWSAVLAVPGGLVVVYLLLALRR